MTTFTRAFPLEDIRIRSGSDGRTVEAYAAVFNSPAEIHDRDGHYLEQIAPSGFNKAIADAAPSGSRTGWLTKVMFNHGRDMYGNSAAEYSMPLGVPLEVKADSRGLLTVTRYARTALADTVLELIREGAIAAQSFQGRFVRSDKRTPRGGFKPSTDGTLTLVTRDEVSLMEYGPTPFPAYTDAAVVGVRGQLLHHLLTEDALADLADLLATRDSAPDEAADTPPGAVEGKPTNSHLFQKLRAEARRKGVL